MPTLPTVMPACLLALVLSACASEPEAAPMRLMVKLAQPSTDASGIAGQVSASIGRPARYVAATSDAWHALSVSCSSEHDCDSVLQRLRADTAHFAAVQRDERKRFVSP